MNWSAMMFGVAAAGLPMSLGAQADEECPAWVEYKIPGLSTKDAARAQAYADCISTPWLPLPAGLEAKLASCASKKPARANARLSKAIAWAEHVTRNSPGCETRLKIKSDHDAHH